MSTGEISSPSREWQKTGHFSRGERRQFPIFFSCLHEKNAMLSRVLAMCLNERKKKRVGCEEKK
jgi:hypothetical protein